MGILDKFKKKKDVEILPELTTEEVEKKLSVATTEALDKLQAIENREATPEKKPADFKTWYASLTPEEKKKVDKRLEKTYFRLGTPIVCQLCNQPGGTLKKVSNRYVHVNCEGINGNR